MKTFQVAQYVGLAFVGLAATTHAVLAPGYVEVDDIHVDLAMPYVGGQWEAFVFTGTVHGEGSYAPNQALLLVNETTMRTRPVGPQFDFIGVPEGSTIWQLSSSQVPGQLYLGVEADYSFDGSIRMLPSNTTNWKSWDPDGAGPTGTFRYVELSIQAVRGPGFFSAWDFPNFAPRAWVASADGIDGSDEFHQLVRSHSHYNWAFTAPGDYEIDLQARTFLGPNSDPGTEVMSHVETFHFRVVPEPGSAALVLLGVLGLCSRRHR
jgi:surface-anchored protein